MIIEWGGCAKWSLLLLRGCKDDVSLNFFLKPVDDSAAEGPKLLASILAVVCSTFRREGLDRSGWMVPDVSSLKAWSRKVIELAGRDAYPSWLHSDTWRASTRRILNCVVLESWMPSVNHGDHSGLGGEFVSSLNGYDADTQSSMVETWTRRNAEEWVMKSR